MDWTGYLYVIIAVIISLTLHEFAHALVGTWLGDTTAQQQGRLTLNPMAHIDPLMTLALPLLLILVHSPVVFGAARPVPFNPWALRYGRFGAAMVAGAGPATNLLLAVFFALWLRFVPINDAGFQFFAALITVNAAFCIFNLIPFPPLDGSRLLYAVAPPALRQLMDTIERFGMMGIVFLLLVAYPFISPVIASMVQGLLNLLVPGMTTL